MYVHAERYVDPTFLERLKRLDRDLEPRWNPAKCRWEIWRRDKYILTVQSVGGDYAPLDNRVLQKLFLCDSHQYGSEVKFIASLHMDDEKLMSMKRKEQDEYVRAIHRDMSPFMRGRKSVNTNKVWEG
jgi:hypothetical protein